MIDSPPEGSIPCDRFQWQWSGSHGTIFQQLQLTFASADICHFHLAQAAVPGKLAVAMPGVGNSQAKHIHIQAYALQRGERKTVHASFFCLYARPLCAAIILQRPYKMRQSHVLCVQLPVTSKGAHKVHSAIQTLACVLASFNIFQLSLITLQTALQWVVRYVRPIC